MIKVAILGYGGRGRRYAGLCRVHPGELKVVDVIDVVPEKRELAKEREHLTDEHVFACLDDFLKQPREADYLFICTQDKEHHEHALKALDAGYNLLLEKPVACSVSDCLDIERKAKEKNLKVDVCHVLRYSRYYEKIKQIMDSGVLGQIISIDQVENVAYWHHAHSYVRGDWRRAEDSNPMILAKCCHDLDLAVYLSGSRFTSVSSVGRNNYFNKEHAPEGATEYCTGGCKAKGSCPYDAERLYISRIKPIPQFIRKNMWPQTRLMTDSIVTIPKLYEAINTTRYGKCVFLSDNDVVDHQSTTICFENGITSTLIMTAYSGGAPYRETRIRGTLGELDCDLGKNLIKMRIFGKRIKNIRTGTFIGGGHGGGDERMISKLAKGQLKTDISMSIESHLIGFAAEESRLEGGKLVTRAAAESAE